MFSSNATQVSAASVAEAVDFDGTNDYLSRASDLTGNADGKTFTFSAWVWLDGGDTAIYSSDPSGSGANFNVLYVSSILQVRGYDTSGSSVCSFDVSGLPRRTFVNILISIDLTNATKYIYINDISTTPSAPSYTNANIDFTSTTQRVGRRANDYSADGRLSNVFLDYTYRNLSITANRRLFVTADLKPAAGQAALNPILYLPMSDPTTVGTNAGTGGNFTLTGTVARSGRGPNQYNAPYSDLDGGSDYVSSTTAPTGIADSKTFTFSFCVQPDAVTTGNRDVIAFGQDAANPAFFVRMTSGGELEIQGYNAAGSVFALGANTGTVFKNGRNYVVTVSVDMSDTGKRHVYINGVVQSVTWSTYSNLTIDFNVATTPKYFFGKSLGTTYYDGRLGAVWFNTSYIDLSVQTNREKFVTGTGINAMPADLGATGELPTGTSPLIYLPMYGNNAGKNYGTGGDFTVNSGPYTGARGPNEFWGNWSDYAVSYLRKTGALTGVSNGKTFSFSVWVRPDVLTATKTIFCFYNGGAVRFELKFASTQFTVTARNSSNTPILNAGTGTVFSTATQYCIQGCIDLSNTSNRAIYVNGALDSTTWTTYTNSDIDFASSTNEVIGVSFPGSASDEYDGKIGELYWTTNYIDFTQEANRLKFRDAFGNPTDLPSAITALSVPNPAVYMRFPPTSFGTNSGTGGDFTVNGTITDGGQF